MEKDINKRKLFFYLCIAISFISIFVYNTLTPYMSDELLFESMNINHMGDVFKETYRLYMQWNGRSVLQTIMNSFLLLPGKGLFNICNSICFVYLMLLIYWNIDGRKKYDVVILVLVHVMVWVFGVDFGQTVLWMSGACNYLWGVAIILSMVTFYRYKIANIASIRYPKLLAGGMFFLGLLSGWCNENTSGGGFLLVLFCTALFYIQNKKLKIWMVTGIVGMMTGLVMMVVAPGNAIRSSYIQEAHAGVIAYLARFLKINNNIYHYFFGLLILTAVFLVYLYLKGKKLREMSWSLALIVVCIATSYALLLTKEPMPRAYFGAGIFLIVACVQAIAYVPKEEISLSTVKYVVLMGLLVYMLFEYCEGGANLARIERELNERELYVKEQVAQGKTELELPMIRTQFDTRFTFIYNNDITEDPAAWGNQIYKTYYGVDFVVGVPREEWTEY